MTSLFSRIRSGVERATFNTANAYYVRGGSVLPASGLRDVMDARLADVAQTARNLTDAYLAGRIGIGDWRDAFAVELRRAHSQVYALGRGGWAQMGDAERQAVSERLRSEFEYLRQFARDVPNLSDAEIAARMDLYANHLNTSFYEGQRGAHDAAGFTQERRVLTAKESCPDCIALAGQDWQPIGTLPVPGDGSQCQSNCGCELQFQ